MTAMTRDWTKTTLGERLTHAVNLRGLTLQKLEQGPYAMSKGYPSRLARGERKKISPEIIEKLCKRLRCDHGWLATGNGPEPAAESATRKRSPKRAS